MTNSVAKCLYGITFLESRVCSLTNSAVTGELDAFVGGAGDDTFLALADGFHNTGDTIDGGAGTDTLIVRQTVADPKSLLLNTTSVEVIKVRVDHDGAAADVMTVDMTDVVGATEVVSFRSVNSASSGDAVITFAGTGMTTDVALGIQGGDTGANQSSIDVTAVYQAVTGTADSSTLNLNGAAANVVTIAGIETLNIVTSKTETSANSKGDSVINSLVAQAAKTVNISGDGKVTLSAIDLAGTVTIDGSSATGAIDVTLEATTKVTFTGGAGADTVTFGAISELTADDTLVGGAGDDTLETSSASLSSAEIALMKSQVSGFEKLGITATASSSFDFDAIDMFDHIVFAKDATITGTAGVQGTAAAGNTAGAGTDATDAIALAGIESGDQVTILKAVTGGAGGAAGTSTAADGGDGSDAISLAADIDGGNDRFTINLDDNITGGDGGAAAVSIAGGDGGDGGDGINAATIDVLTLNILGTGAVTIDGGSKGLSTGTGADGSDGEAIVLAANGELVITGAADLTIAEVVGTNLTISAGSFTGDLTITGEAGNNTVVFGSGDDTFTKIGGTDTITLGAGADTIVFQDLTNDSVNDAGTAIITDFSSEDRLSFDKSGLALPGTAADPLASSSYYEGTVASMTAGTDFTVVILTEAFSSVGAMEEALSAKSSASGNALVGFFNSTSGRFEMYIDDAKGTDNDIAAGDLVLAMTNITSADQIADILSSDTFILVV